jgi:signal peptidase II
MIGANGRYFALMAGLVALDQAAKAVLVKLVPLYGTVTVVPGFFAVTHVRNKGAIFGMFNRSGVKSVTVLLMIASVTALGFVVYYFLKTPASQRWTKVALSLILAGAVGNQIDRLVRGSVVDFFEMHVKGFYWPTYNIADACISIGAVLLAGLILFRRS